MSRYAIGDLQGCFSELLELLDTVNFDESNDLLLFTGDLVNRGPQSLESLRFVRNLGEKAITVLGNHDMHLLAIANGQEQYMHKGDTLDEILSAPDRDELLTWLRQQPFLHRETDLNFTVIHAGLPPQWEVNEAADYANEIESVLRGENYRDFFMSMYGNMPDNWSDNLVGWERLRVIVNYLTRIRYCHADGRLVYKDKGIPGQADKSYQPWFEIPGRKSINDKIIFGHWASLRDYHTDYTRYNVFPLDMGCVWGGELRAVRLEDEKFFSVPSRQTPYTSK